MGLTIPGLGVNVDEIYPGKVVEVDVTPDKPGRYAFACTRWCGVDHWRIRGVIEVTGGSAAGGGRRNSRPFSSSSALTSTPCGMRRKSRPRGQPSIGAGAALNAKLPQDLTDPAKRRTLTPADAFQTMRAIPPTPR